MAVTKITYTGNGSQTQFTIPFEYIAEADVDVYIDTVLQLQQNTTSTAAADHPQVVSGEINQGTALINYTFANATTIQFNSAPANGAFIFIERTTDDTSIVTFTPGSTIRAQELNSALEQVRFIAQEGTNTAQDGVVASKDNSASIDGQGKRLENLADANSDDDAVTRAQLGKVITDDLLEGEAIDLTDATGGSNSNKQVTISVEDSSKTNKGAVSINEGHAIGVTYTSGDAVIAADKSTASQQGVVKITAPSVANGNPITLTRPGDGEVELTIADGSIDVQKIKGLDKADTSEYASTWDNDDDQVATVGAIAKRLDAIVSTSQPTTAQVGKFWYNPTEGINALYMWNGTSWKVLTSGTPYIPAGTTIVRYVDAVNGSDDVNNSGFLPQSPLRTIKRAITLINASASGDGTLVVVEPGVYQEALPLRIEKNNVSVVGKALRSCFIHPTVATENNNMWEVDSGSYIANFTMLGLKVPTNDQGSRNNSIDNDATYGLPSNQPFAVSFRSGNPVILKSPYIQNCTHFSDAHFDNANFDPNTFPSTDAQTYSAVAGDQTSAPCGGGLLVDGSVPASTSPIRSMVVDAFTQITLDGPGILVTNNGYAQLVSFFGTFCHYHAKAKNGGQINLSNCVTDFGRYGLIAEGKSPTAIATATASAANAGATTVTIGSITSAGSFHGTVSRPLDHMMITIDGADYGVVSSTANGSGWDVTITPALASNISNNSVSFALRSYISTGGHTFEYVGVGTDYSDHPDNGGVAVEANQVKEFNGGKVWQSSTDHIGKFKAGNVLTVDQIAETLSVNGNITVTGTNAVNGNITVTGTVDGRDVATDGTKLDGIEAGATADQTAAEIRTLVESATDSNVFTDADHTKLNGIETGATADQTASEIRSLVESATDSNVFTDADHTKLNGIETGATADQTASEIKTAYESNSNTNAFTDAEKTKLSGIATGATAYANSDVDAHLNQSTAASGEVLSWNGSDYDWVAQSSGGISNNSSRPNSTGLGTNALDSETTATDNTALGYNASTALTTGGRNVAIGSNAFATASTSVDSVAVGYQALKNYTGYGIVVAVGRDTLRDLTTTYDVVAVGNNVARSMTTGGNNSTFIGTWAGSSHTTGTNTTAVGRNSLGGVTTGSNNTGLGLSAGSNITTGGNNIVIGASASASSAGVSNEITLGDANITSLRIPGLQSGAANGSVLTYNSSTGKITLAAASGGASSLNDLSDAVVKYTSTSTSASIGIGENALSSDDSSDNENTAVGAGALENNTTGPGNNAFGRFALNSNTTGFSNVAFGGTALANNTTGDQNVAVGTSALGSNNTTHNGSTAIGYRAGRLAASNYVTAVGYEAALNATTPVVCLGYQAGKTATSAVGLTAIGYEALKGITTGAKNVAIGYQAGSSATTSHSGVVIGYQAGQSFGNESVHIGIEAGKNSTGTRGIAIGHSSLPNATGGGNVAIGGGSPGLSVTSGSNMVLIGANAGSNLTTGTNNICIGPLTTGSSATVSNEITLGNSSITSLRIPGLQSGASDGQVLTYNSTNGNITLADAGGGLSDNSTAARSLGIGDNALSSENSNGNNNTALGYYALAAATSATQNTAVGSMAARTLTTGTENSSFGYQALYNTSTAHRNCAFGRHSLYSNVSGSDNCGLGTATLQNNSTGHSNSALGHEVLKSNTTGTKNTGFGYKALYNNSTAVENTAVGYQAAYSNQTEGYLTAVGYQAAYNSTSGYVTAVGYASCYNSTSAFMVTGIGYNTLFNNTTGRYHVAIGNQALQSCTTAWYNVAIGSSCLGNSTTAGFNNAVGVSAMHQNTTGANNTAFGYQALYNNTTGAFSVAVGNEALKWNRGAQCTAVGYQALLGVSGSNSANYNTAVGFEAGKATTTGTDNTFVGYKAGLNNTTGAYNVFVGRECGSSATNNLSHMIGIGRAALQNATAGDVIGIGKFAAQGAVGSHVIAIGEYAGNQSTVGSVYIGYEAGKNNNGSYNVCVGYDAGPGNSAGNGVYIGREAGNLTGGGANVIVIGAEADPSASNISNEVTLGNSSISTLRCNTQTISSLSDGRDKTEVEDLPLGLDFIDTLRPVKFKWDTRDGNGKDGTYDAGFIAQDLQSAQSTSDAEYLKMVMDSNPDRLEARYGQLIPVLVQAIKDLKSEIETLKSNA